MKLSEFVKLDNDKKKEFYLSLDWHDFVMSLLDETEQVDGYPKADGLRRVSELLLGDIIDSKPTEIFPVNGNSVGRATVCYSVKFRWWDDSERVYADVADVFSQNIDPEFLVFALATAATRAEGRALRKALKLKKCTAEEVVEKRPVNVRKPVNNDALEVPLVTENQIAFLTSRCKQLNINLMSFINSSDERFDKVELLTKKKCSEFLDLVNKYYNNQDTIPEELLGYQENWRN